MRYPGEEGFSVIEMMIVVTIIGILGVIAMPSLRSMLLNMQIRAAADSINNGIQLAKGEAVRRNVTVRFVMTNANGVGWMVGCQTPIADANGDGLEDCPTTIQSKSAGDSTNAAVVTVTPAGADTLTFNGLGRVTANIDASNSITAVDVDVDSADLPAADSRNLRVVVSGGSVRLCDPSILTVGDARGC